jgi:hypothetical protein
VVVLYCLLRFPDRRHSGACAGFDVDVNEDEPFLIDAAGEVLQQHDVAKRDGASGSTRRQLASAYVVGELDLRINYEPQQDSHSAT